jgi:prepilin-type N-terminal cleavage/methylation domain-containing protein
MRNARRGFTLIEMMIVVAVIAILAMVVVPTFFRDSNKTKSISEVTPMFTEMAAKLEQYKSETGKYVNTTTLENDTPIVCPSVPNPRIAPAFQTLRCSYEIQVGEAGDTYQGTLPTGLTFTAPSTTGWWTLLATCDADGQGTSSTNGTFLMHSVDQTLQKVNDAY